MTLVDHKAVLIFYTVYSNIYIILRIILAHRAYDLLAFYIKFMYIKDMNGNERSRWRIR